jgi:hypothetical protein
MTKATIIQRLLDEKHITAEEAMILMAQDPIPMTAPYNPYSPPFEPGDSTGNPTQPFYYTTDTNTTYRED